jgi:Kdo2-lipid IVA lauroyltransferase/acyltransferase
MISMKKFRHLLEYCGVRVLVCGIRLLPVVIAIRLGRFLGIVVGYIIKSRMQLGHENLQRAFGDRFSYTERCSILRSLMALLGEALVESVIITPEDVEANVEIEGFHHLEQALSLGRGAILLGPHSGMWELAGHVFGARLERAATLYKPLKNKLVDRYVLASRAQSSMKIIPNQNTLTGVMRRLRENYAVVFLYDQNAGRSGVMATFFGLPAMTYAAPAALSRKTGCPVVPGCFIKLPGYRKHRMVLYEPFPPIDTGNPGNDLLATVQQYNDFIEEVVRHHPEQWFGWLHNRWKISRRAQAAQQAAMPPS